MGGRLSAVKAVECHRMLDWNQREIPATCSRGGVCAVADFLDNLIRVPDAPWPPGSIVQKLYESRQARAYDEASLAIVTRRLGYYCDLQSLHSEDAITWSYFGPLTYLPFARQAHFLNWLLRRINLPGEDRCCEIALFRRIPHPERMVPGGPENDFYLLGDRTVVFGEAKWRSPIGIRQGINRDRNQIELRDMFLRSCGRPIFGPRRLVVLSVWRRMPLPARDSPEGVVHASLTWEDLAAYEDHPQAEEFGRYLKWKQANSQP